MGILNKIEKLFSPAEGRVEAFEKVTGRGKYAAEYQADKLCYGVLVTSNIAAGTIKSLKTEEAKLADGVIEIVSHLNKPTVPGLMNEQKVKEARVGLPVFHTDKIYFKGQPIALVVAETFEEATYAASLVKAEYTPDKFNIDFEEAHEKVPMKEAGKERGNEAAWAAAPVRIEAEYTIKPEVHNPMEMHATIAQWTANDKLKLHDKSQGVNGVQRTMSAVFGIPATNIEVISEFVGGGFGSGLRVWPNTIIAAMAAKMVNRPVKLVLTRPQMFFLSGYRPQSWQRIVLGADQEGNLQGLIHEARHNTSMYDNFNENITRISRLVYKIPNVKTASAIVPLNLSTPTWMRGPGDCTGDFAIESAIDELSYKVKQDPVELRLKNVSTQTDPDTSKPWSTNFLDECMKQGAEKIGWKNRKPNPGEHTDGEWKIGYGMALGMWLAGRNKASAGISMNKDGSVTVLTAMTDIGTGTGTGMVNITHEYTGIPKEKIKVELGNSNLPPAPSQGGSTGLSSISGAMVAACEALKQKLAGYAAMQNEVYKNAAAADIKLSDKGIGFKSANDQFISFADLFEKNKLDKVEVDATSGPGEERQKYSFCSGAAHFCIVRVHTKTGKVKIDRMVSVADGGTIVNEKAAANQVSGAAVGGIGMALMEEAHLDKRLGSLLNNDLAGYHFAVNADAPIVEVSFINKTDPNINPVGSKGLGEVGIIGCAAAISNAIYHATGKRFRDLPITPDKVLMG